MLYSGKNPIAADDKKPQGQFVSINGERFYEIAYYDKMQPFFISLATDTDLWMYIASTGGLTAGRQSPEKALFPYYTDDKITEQYEQTGSKTIIRVSQVGMVDEVMLWEPFSERQAGVYQIERRIAKSCVGNKLVFCEENRTLGLRFSYIWESADRYGWIRRATLENLTGGKVNIEMLDGLQNVLPSGVERVTQNTYSTLVDGYKKTELVNDSLVLFRMEAILVDRAEPSESLKCNTIYNLGLEGADYLLSSRQLDSFRRGYEIEPETESKGVRGAIIAHYSTVLEAHSSLTWYFVCDVAKDAVEVREIMHFMKSDNAIQAIDEAVEQGTQTLQSIVGQNDGVQLSGDEFDNARHFANTLFNTMRGGFYVDNYNIDREAFIKHLSVFNKQVVEKHKSFLEALPQTIKYAELEQIVSEQNDPQLRRLLLEYLPITFGRRHGDPSRPWNLFSIRVNDENGKRIISYQGNWRDIFQNWEALSFSYPQYINGIIAKFLNATTVDGYNPYKVTSEGIDWEVIEKDNPWSNIGYWGDHQIIYLLKLLELSYKHDSAALRSLLNERLFAFANVPYRLKSYADIVADPKNSIRFDDDLHKHIFDLIPTYGQDARLVQDKQGEVYLTTFADKLLITLLAKLSNFIPEAGIWMNTLRPEWNDANNALVGFGASMVTLCYMRRYVSFLSEMVDTDVTVAAETAELLQAILYSAEAVTTMNDIVRRQFTDAVGKAGEAYRAKAYAGLSGEMVTLSVADLRRFLSTIEKMIDDSIHHNKRADGLYEAYNLIKFTQDGIEVTHLYEMLEGQVAVLTSGVLSAAESADLLDAMRCSNLYRADQRSYMLYPARRRKTFLELNDIPEQARKMPVVQDLLAKGKNGGSTPIITEDREGGLHFNAGFNNAAFLERAARANGMQESDIAALTDLYEQVFNHQAFTGRSGTFYKYEGLGCIYWHMVSKLLLAVGETIERTEHTQTELQRLQKHYRLIREGIGSHKTPEEYGSFPFDAYSHTPSMAGVQQPGMTGQVKEDIINRFFELGVQVVDGELHINPLMLEDKDFSAGELSFTYCAVPFLYKKAAEKGIVINTRTDSIRTEGNVISREVAQHIFNRDNIIKSVIVYL